ncbi:DUF4393 domain-containing protein [Pseudomonas tolaasii]|uniref:DUF4393 domain-containing protein n=1 Tax=Pseudomonas tolaasii TaxID=29442 RepID=UPI0015A2B0ED|nr:DUF4393 domain-containing protein [Pseudomonas tolaasii]NWC26360.1 DUF4393 domain-containing protein [Pseudomonas tolaasii]NWC49780.1 DUF4393 domain-containing protein [Pseudomonas tolaasii]NWE63712.1 DUF4393 domain-containing protein [Pseudomonas tolaasii]
MGEESSGDNKVKETIEAVTGLVKAVPVYEDMVQPVAKQLGKSLETVGKAINVALAPVGMLVWGYDKCQEFIQTKVADRLKDVPPEDIITPKPNVAGPAIEALRYTGHEESLSDMYASLLATAMSRHTADGAHPAFVEIIKQFTPDEARLVAYFTKRLPFPIVTVRSSHVDFTKGGTSLAPNVSLFGVKAGLQLPHLVPTYLDNLCRLGIVEIGAAYIDSGLYTELLASPEVTSWQGIQFLKADHEISHLKASVDLTSLGRQFGYACLRDHKET